VRRVVDIAIACAVPAGVSGVSVTVRISLRIP
jgi:hypothetical protein